MDRANQRPQQVIHPYKLSSNFRKKKWIYESFKGGQMPLLYVEGVTNSFPVMPLATGGAADGELDQGVTAHAITPAGGYWDVFATTAQTKSPMIPVAASGLKISGDEVDNEALEFILGGVGADTYFANVVGTNLGWYWRCRFKLTDASGSDQFGILLRKQEAFAVPTSFLAAGDGIYTDFVLFGFAGTKANPNPVRISYDQNNSGIATVQDAGFTWADTLIHDLEMRVVGGRVLFFINGKRLGNPVAFDAVGGAITSQDTVSGPAITLDSGDTMLMGIFLRHDADVLESTFLVEYEAGHLVDVGLDPNNETAG